MAGNSDTSSPPDKPEIAPETTTTTSTALTSTVSSTASASDPKMSPPKSSSISPLQNDPPPPQQPTEDPPAAFPPKRRGRPPGRPNMTVREEDFSSDPIVQKWNAAKYENPLIVHAVSIRDALSESALVHEVQKEVFKRPSREIIYFVKGWITARHIASKRPSYVNGLLIHSRGADATNQCAQCIDRRSKNALGPFPSCRTLPGMYFNCCSNCKWFDGASACSLYTGQPPNRKRKSKSGNDDSGEVNAQISNKRNGSGSAPVSEQQPQQPPQTQAQRQEMSPLTVAPGSPTSTNNHHLLHPDLLAGTTTTTTGNNQSLAVDNTTEGSNSNSSSVQGQNNSPIAGLADEADARLAEELSSVIH
ncbi:hypothetical protein QBC38DRAFT_490761 [Podospora fimiseda]|uniref:Uncharacterized protein n=1 Tax=Podospora fimiseda TaxID=252190 RepID=A0AAN7BFD1_9PEZI|nr:hypothetical protein QBC38DRAFT_490761 [Podospora fimiseda]